MQKNYIWIIVLDLAIINNKIEVEYTLKYLFIKLY